MEHEQHMEKKTIWKKPMEKDMETHSEKHMVKKKKNWGEKQMQKQVEIM